MKLLRLAAALSAIPLLALGATPALAADDLPTITSTGLADGQYVGSIQTLHPVWTNPAAVTGVDLYVDNQLRARFRDQEWLDNRLYLGFDAADDGTDALIALTVYGPHGLAGSASTHVHVDTQAPTATFTPERNAFIHGLATITVTPISDDVASIGLYDFGIVLASTTTAPWKLVIDTRIIPAGTNYALVVRDRAGNATAFDTDYRIDNAGPEIDAFHDFPRTVPTGTSRLNDGSQDPADIGRVEWWIDGARRGTGRSIDYDFGRVQRTATVEIRAWDRLDNASSKTFTLLVDRSGPSVAWKAPGPYVRGSTMTTAIAASDPSGVQFAALDGYNPDFGAPYSQKLRTGRDGRRTLRWSVYDNFGNRTIVSRTTTVDNTRPKLTVAKAPKNGARAGGTVRVTLSASDHNGVARVDLLINGRVVARDVRSAYGFTINTRPYGKTFKITFRAADRAGNTRTTATRTWHR